MNEIGDAQARLGAVESGHSVLVQAPAGSGKTTLLTQRYLRLLAQVEAPEAILALTFTRLAAQEMRRRVLDALAAAGDAVCPPRLNERTWQLAAAAKRHLDALQVNIAAQPGRLRIETIDAFNAWLANQLPVAAGAGTGLRVLTDAKGCYQEAARRALAHAGDDAFGAAVDRVLAVDDQRFGQLVDLITEMLPARDRWLPLLAGNLRAASTLDLSQLLTIRAHFDQDLGLLITRTLLHARDVLGGERLDACARLLGGAARRLGEQAAHLAGWREDLTPLRTDAADVARWRGLAINMLTNDRKLRKQVNKNQGFPQGCADKPAMEDLLKELQRDPQVCGVLRELHALPDPAYSDEQWTRIRDVAQVLVLAAAELDSVFREQGAVDFSAVSIAALRALGDDAPSDLALRLDYRLQHLLVDEFQDTSGAQLGLVQRLTAGWHAGDGRSAFCVGDPMQSIYGFREAEVRAFLELADEGLGDVRFEVQRLQTNFRSTANIVDWINGCFSRLMPRDDDRERGAIAFRPSRAAARHASSVAGDVRVYGYADRQEEADGIAAAIEAELALHPEWQVAVLVRAKSHAAAIAASLRSRGIGFRAVDIEPLSDRGVVRDIIMLTRALLHFGDRTAWLALLRAPWAGLELADLLLLARAQPLIWDALQDETVLQQLSEPARVRCQRVCETLSAAFMVRNESSLTRWIERTWLCLGGASCASGEPDLELARAAFHRLDELEQRGMPDVSELSDSFAELFADSGACGAVQIMTIHRAKGLEFDFVVLPALNRPSPPNQGRMLLALPFSRAGRGGLVMAARPAVGAERDRLFDFLRHQQTAASKLEAQRLLYVACTRAKSRLWLTASFDTVPEPDVDNRDAEDAGDAAPARPRAGSLLAVLWPAVHAEFVMVQRPAGDAQAGGAQAFTDGAPRGGPLSRLPLDFSQHLPALPLPTDVLPTREVRDETPVFDWAGHTARRVGTLVHAELQHLDLQRADRALLESRDADFRRWLAMHGVPADRLAQAAARVTQALLAVHDDERARWMLASGYRDDWREHALSGILDDQIHHIVLDRSFIDDGTRWIIDYKTSQHQGSGLEQFLDREVDRYRPQLHRYARLAQKLGPEPIRLGLYFPLMRAWREVDFPSP
jgi:ATP-dependent exoDNAse (exonuclease V) beta subunit